MRVDTTIHVILLAGSLELPVALESRYESRLRHYIEHPLALLQVLVDNDLH